MKKNPEVGDLWEHIHHKSLLHIIDVGHNFIRFIGRTKEQWGERTMVEYYENSFSMDDERLIHFTEIYTYIGKSKSNINEFFEIKDE